MAGTALDTDRVVTGSANGPGIYLAPEGSDPPTDADTALDAAFYTVGYLGEEGPQPSFDPTFTDIPAWQSAFPIKRVPGAATLTVAFTMKEVAPESVATYFGTAVPTETTGEFEIAGASTPNPPVLSVVISAAEGTSYARLWVARAQLSAAGAMLFSRTDAISMPVTLSMLDNSGSAPFRFFSKQAVA